MKTNDDLINIIELKLLWTICFTSTIQIFIIPIGNIAIHITPILATIYLICKTLRRNGRLYFPRSYSGLFLFFYLLYCAMTVILSYIVGLEDQIDCFFKGILVLSSQITTYLAVILEPSDKQIDKALSGLTIGIIINAIYGIYQCVGSFYNFPGVVLPSPILNSNPMLLHRAQGFFAEPSYYAALLVPGVFLIFDLHSRWRIILLILVICGLILSSSSGAILAFLGVFIYSINHFLKLLRGKKIRISDPPRWAAGMFFAFMLIVFVGASWNPSSASTRLVRILRGANPYELDNFERLSSILRSLELFLTHPLGIGYNMGPSFMVRLGYGTHIHSLFGAVLLETGLPGLFLLCAFVMSPSIPLLTRKNEGLIAIAALISLLYSFATCNSIFYFQMVIWGVTTVIFGLLDGQTNGNSGLRTKELRE